MANKLRSEFKIRLAGKEYNARPDFDAICNFEDEADTSCLDVAQLMLKQRMPKTRVIVAAVWAGVNGGGASLSMQDVAEMVMQDGVHLHIENAVKFIENAVSSDQPTHPRELEEKEAPK